MYDIYSAIQESCLDGMSHTFTFMSHTFGCLDILFGMETTAFLKTFLLSHISESDTMSESVNKLRKDFNVMKQNFRRSQILATNTPEAEKMRRDASERKRMQRLRDKEKRKCRRIW